MESKTAWNSDTSHVSCPLWVGLQVHQSLLALMLYQNTIFVLYSMGFCLLLNVRSIWEQTVFFFFFFFFFGGGGGGGEGGGVTLNPVISQGVVYNIPEDAPYKEVYFQNKGLFSGYSKIQFF